MADKLFNRLLTWHGTVLYMYIIVIAQLPRIYGSKPTRVQGRFTLPIVPQTVAKIAIGDYPMASGDCIVTLIVKLAKVRAV